MRRNGLPGPGAARARGRSSRLLVQAQEGYSWSWVQGARKPLWSGSGGTPAARLFAHPPRRGAEGQGPSVRFQGRSALVWVPQGHEGPLVVSQRQRLRPSGAWGWEKPLLLGMQRGTKSPPCQASSPPGMRGRGTRPWLAKHTDKIVLRRSYSQNNTDRLIIN